MSLDPRAQRLLNMLAASGDPGLGQTAQDRRRGLEDLAAMFGGIAPDMASVHTFHIAGPGGPIAVRRYRPHAAGSGALLFFHGGGWVAGGLETHDGACRRLAKASARQVFAVDYRLAPEHPFPAALDDAQAALTWAATAGRVQGFDPSDLVVAGDSAGGALASAACIAARDRGERIVAGLLLICPILDLATERPSRRAFSDGYFLKSATMAQDLADYAPAGTALSDPRLSPLLAEDLGDLPPTHVHVAQYDPFRDEGLAFGRRIAAAGGTAKTTEHPGMIHYFYALPGAIPYAEKALAEMGAALASAPF
jgi:acetyl esterase/lipase